MFLQRTENTIEPMLLTAREAARLLSISERTLFTLSKSGQIPVVKIGDRGIRYDRDDLRAFVEAAKESQESS